MNPNGKAPFDKALVERAMKPAYDAFRQAKKIIRDKHEYGRVPAHKVRQTFPDVDELLRAGGMAAIQAQRAVQDEINAEVAKLQAAIDAPPPVTGDVASVLNYHRATYESYPDDKLLAEWGLAIAAKDGLRARAISEMVRSRQAADTSINNPRTLRGRQDVEDMAKRTAELIATTEQKAAGERLAVLEATVTEMERQNAQHQARVQLAEVDERGYYDVPDDLKAARKDFADLP